MAELPHKFCRSASPQADVCWSLASESVKSKDASSTLSLSEKCQTSALLYRQSEHSALASEETRTLLTLFTCCSSLCLEMGHVELCSKHLGWRLSEELHDGRSSDVKSCFCWQVRAQTIIIVTVDPSVRTFQTAWFSNPSPNIHTMIPTRYMGLLSYNFLQSSDLYFLEQWDDFKEERLLLSGFPALFCPWIQYFVLVIFFFPTKCKSLLKPPKIKIHVIPSLLFVFFVQLKMWHESFLPDALTKRVSHYNLFRSTVLNKQFLEYRS